MTLSTTKQTVPLGLLFSTTGTYGSVGQAMLSGSLLAIEEIAADKQFDFAFEPVIADPGGDLSRYTELAQTILEDRSVTHVVGCYTSSSRKEVVPVFERANALLWYPSHYEGFECSDNVIYVGSSPNQHIVPLAGYMLSVYGNRIYTIGSNYVWAWESNRVMRDIVETHGGELLAERYLSLDDTDVEWIVDEIRALKPDFIFSTLIGASTHAFLNRYSEAVRQGELGDCPAPPIASCNLSETELQHVDPQARAGHFSSSVYFQSIISPANSLFVSQYKARFGAANVTSVDAEASYNAVHLLARAIQKAGKHDVASIREAITECTFDAPQGCVRVDPGNFHCVLTPRLGRSEENGQFEVIMGGHSPLSPDPYLAWFDAKHDVDAWSVFKDSSNASEAATPAQVVK
ncbi:transporter substrate-binding domain-containing protein [Pseudomonas helleri]|uniref:Transporter substrate-binding protein n=1 Tax=Pseudomonas helleri TaxID=1608996 RepID=A0A7X1WTZ0_9PSED|nr:transporter substrate-binding domain-containing protein [Pseudomonas helleri]MQT74554.1 transporter substrate-binding protein [Pseudomonas helleri]